MPEQIIFSASAAVTGGPRIGFSRTIELEAYNKITIALEDKKDITVDLGVAGTAVRLLFVLPSAFSTALKFQVNASGDSRPLDQPLVLSGSGALALLSPTLTSLRFDNQTGANVTIEILVARDLTP